MYSDVISGIVVDPTGVKVPLKFGDSKSNRSRDIRLPHFDTNYNDIDYTPQSDVPFDNMAKRQRSFA